MSIIRSGSIMTKDDNEKSSSLPWGFNNLLKGLIWIVLIYSILSTVYTIISPLLPTPLEYTGRFPANIDENIANWGNVILRHLALYGDYFSLYWLTQLLSQIFFIFLVLNVKKVVDDGMLTKPPENLINNYLNWALGSILITIVFILKFITDSFYAITVAVVGLAVAGLVVNYLKKVHKG